MQSLSTCSESLAGTRASARKIGIASRGSGPGGARKPLNNRPATSAVMVATPLVASALRSATSSLATSPQASTGTETCSTRSLRMRDLRRITCQALTTDGFGGLSNRSTTPSASSIRYLRLRSRSTRRRASEGARRSQFLPVFVGRSWRVTATRVSTAEGCHRR